MPPAEPEPAAAAKKKPAPSASGSAGKSSGSGEAKVPKWLKLSKFFFLRSLRPLNLGKGIDERSVFCFAEK